MPIGRPPNVRTCKTAYILDAHEDSDQWQEVLEQLPRSLQDVYFQPDYVRLHCFGPESRAVLFVYESGSKIWAYPFLMRGIPKTWYDLESGPWFDVESAYGYGGPLSNSSCPIFLSDAHTAFRAWCARHGVVAEFVRFHPVLDTHSWCGEGMEILVDRKTYSIQIDRVRGDVWPTAPSARNKLRRAVREGVRIRMGRIGEDFENFIGLYRTAMDRLQADPFYYFDGAYFSGLRVLLGRVGFLLLAECKGDLVGGALFLRGKTGLHYHLAASDRAKRIPGVANLLIEGAVQECQVSQLSWLHMGGGVTSDNDSLAAFKKSMSTNSHNFRIGKRIHDASVYKHLRERWMKSHPVLAAQFGKRLLCYRHRATSEAGT